MAPDYGGHFFLVEGDMGKTYKDQKRYNGKRKPQLPRVPPIQKRSEPHQTVDRERTLEDELRDAELWEQREAWEDEDEV